ncbi:MAG: ribosome maturation factor RimP [Rhodothermales bacterium]|nr:ribosome maturation factor RimP [Rhodothermales bacterium]
MSGTDIRSRIERFAEEVLAENGDLYLVDVVVRGRKGSRVVEVYVDGDEGVGVDDLARLSREIGFLLETEDVIKGKYNLNVSSPGEDRSLKMPRQYRRHVGKPIDVKVAADEVDGEGLVSGVNRGVDGDVLRLETDNGEQISIPLDQVESAKVKLPW